MKNILGVMPNYLMIVPISEIEWNISIFVVPGVGVRDHVLEVHQQQLSSTILSKENNSINKLNNCKYYFSSCFPKLQMIFETDNLSVSLIYIWAYKELLVFLKREFVDTSFKEHLNFE